MSKKNWILGSDFAPGLVIKSLSQAVRNDKIEVT